MTPATQTERAGRLERVVERERFLVQGSWVTTMTDLGWLTSACSRRRPGVVALCGASDRRG
jgi:hypothetical protein